ncbi:MAG: transcriptional regulator, partial [Candidatus Uhrbacteria bacterium GW2011_GWF2_44_350]
MSGHSHFHNIQTVKGKADAVRGKVFSKLAKNITIAAKDGGGDPSFNFKLRVAIDAAKAVNMPKDNIERAVNRGVGGGEDTVLEEVVYEGFGPGGVAILVQCLTDNRNRTAADIKTQVSKAGGNIGAPGSVMWMFEKKGVVGFADPSIVSDRNSFELSMIDAGAEDISFFEDSIQIICDIKDLKKVVEAVEVLNLKPDAANLEFVAKTTTKVEDPEVQKQIKDFIEKIEENDDVDA